MKILIVDEILKDKKSWKNIYDKCYNYVKQNIGEEHCFKKNVAFKFRCKDAVVYKLPINKFIINLILWTGFIDFKLSEPMGFKYIFNPKILTKFEISNYINNLIIKQFMKNRNVSISKINKSCARIIELLAKVSDDFDVIMSITTNLKDTIDLAKKNEEFNKLLNTKIPNNLQPKEIEELLNKLNDRMMNILKTEENNLQPIFLCGEGINSKQFKEYQLNIGLKPDLDGNTYPVPINTNFLTKGLQTPSNYLLNSTGGRKALIMNKNNTGKAGYFARRLSLLASSTTINPEQSCCNTKHLIKFQVKSKKYLNLIDLRYYSFSRDGKVFKLIDSEKDEHLIGKTIYLRSPITCSHDKICNVCYGDLSYINKDIHTGIFAAQEITSVLTQMILSAKHLLTTNSIKIEMSPGFEGMFVIEGNSILLDQTFENTKNLFLSFDIEDVEMEDEYDKDNTNYTINFFKIRDNNQNTICTIKEMNDKKMYLSEFAERLFKKYKSKNKNKLIDIPISKLDPIEPLFFMEVENKELNKTLKNIMSLIDNNKHCGCNTMDEMVQKMADFLIEAKINKNLLHYEMCMVNLFRTKENILKRPDYSKPEIDYKILSVRTALTKNPSPIVSLAYERIEQQLKQPLTYAKSESSMLDTLFKE